MYRPDEPDYKRLFVAIFLAAALLISWQALVVWPKRQHIAQYSAEQTKKHAAEQREYATRAPGKEMMAEATTAMPRPDRLKLAPRVKLRTPTLHGSISLKGARIDDLTLVRYRETVDPNSPEVVLLSPAGDKSTYFAQAGWLSADDKTRVPDGESLWQADRQELAPGKPVTLTWNNGTGQTYVIRIAVDDKYMFTLTQQVRNDSGQAIHVMPYAFINRSHEDNAQHYGIMHEGPIGVMEGSLEEVPYQELREKGNKTFENASGWLGISDKYWLTALVPQGTYKATFSHYEARGLNRYQIDYLGNAEQVTPGAANEQRLLLFAGAKEIEAIDAYAQGDAVRQVPPIPLFDRAIDFGTLYFLTKPMLLLLTFFYNHIGNFGIAIMLLTIVVKLLMYPLANKSYHSMASMRELQPEVMKIRERYHDDAIKMNQEMMALYKREKVNPASGCLPVLIQMPVFFALYKVLYVSLEMRHAPFFGWLTDLSAPDPSNLFTLFGVLHWDTPSWMHLGILPILMTATMVIQMKQQPKPADPVQAKMMTYMPYFFLFIFVSFPAGLVLYWTWSNILSILQQAIIIRQHKRKQELAKPKAA